MSHAKQPCHHPVNYVLTLVGSSKKLMLASKLIPYVKSLYIHILLGMKEFFHTTHQRGCLFLINLTQSNLVSLEKEK